MISYNVLTLAAETGTKPGNPLLTFAPIIILGVMIFILFRAQRKEQKRRKEMIDSVSTGDRITTIGGIHGIVTNVKEDKLVVKISDNVKVEMTRSAVASLREQEKQEENYRK